MPTQKKSTKKKAIAKGKFKDNIYGIIPLLFIIGIIPLIIFMKTVTVNGIEKMYAVGSDTHVDIFSYYKMVYLLLFSAAGLLIYLLMKRDNPFDMQRKIYYIPMGIYSIFIILSALTSDYKSVAFRGFLERYEGAFVLIAYVVIMFLAMNVFKEDKSIKKLFICLLSSSFVISMLGVLQFFGINYYESDFIINLITPIAIEEKGGFLETSFDSNVIFSTLYNPNYVGSYVAMLMPIILIFLVWLKNIFHKVILAALICLIAINWIGCDSRAGIVGGIVSLLVILIMFRKKIMNYKKIVISVGILIFIGLVGLNFATNGSVVKRVLRMTSIEGKENISATKIEMDKILQGLVDISVDSEKAKIITEKGTLQVIVSERKLNIADENNKELEYSLDNNIVSFTDPRFLNIKIGTKPKEGLMEIYYNDFHLIKIVVTKEGLESSSNRWMTYRGNKNIEAFGFSGKESFGSNRGYIWSRTIPLLKNTILLGHGPDTFPIYFPQYDYINKLKLYGVGGIFVDKPHNMYLQTAINTGVFSLLAMLTLFGMYFTSSIKIYIKEEFTTFHSIAGLACFAAFCGYAAAGVFNDSVVSVAPVFWVLLGLGIGINIRLRKS